MLSAALTRALTTPAFVAADFVPTQWDTAEQKAKFANALLTFVTQDFRVCYENYREKRSYRRNDDFPRSKFHESFYRRLSNTFGHIACYNCDGFYGRFFLTAAGQARIPRAVRDMALPRRSDLHLFGRRARRRCASYAKPDRRDPQFADRGRAQAAGARASFGAQGPLRADRRGAGYR